jgi:hypothetical protein
VVAPEIPDEVVAADLDRTVRSRLRTLSKDNADGVARHLVMAGLLIDEDPELAYSHAQAAVRRAGRVDVVREAAAIAAYRTGRYAEALRELRTVRRLNGSDEHLPLMADCERGLGRPERALALAADDVARALPPELQVEMAIVVSGARLDLGEADAAVATLSTPLVRAAQGEQRVRVGHALVAALRSANRPDEAERLAASLPAVESDEEEVMVYDLEDLVEDTGDTGDGASADGVAAGVDAGDSAVPGHALDGDSAGPLHPVAAEAAPTEEDPS